MTTNDPLPEGVKTLQECLSALMSDPEVSEASAAAIQRGVKEAQRPDAKPLPHRLRDEAFSPAL